MKDTKSLTQFAAALFITLMVLTGTRVMAWGYGRTPVDSQAPTVPGELSVTNTAYTSISLSWRASHDNVKVKGYQVYRDGERISSTAKTSYINNNLTPGRKYTYTIRAYDDAGNLSGSSNPINVTTLSDVQNPSTPENLTASAVTHTTITLSWDSSSDNTSIKGYEIYCNGKKKASRTDAYYAVKSLSPGTAYTFYVKAYDIAGNYSGQSKSVSAGTIADTSAPTVPSGLKVTSASETEVNLAWSPSSDNVKVKHYDILCNGKKVSTTTKTAYCCKRLLPGSSYTFSIKAADTSLNMSAGSNIVKVATLKDEQPPSAPTGLRVKSVRGSSVSLEWDASTDNIKVKGYQIYCNGIALESATRTSRTVKNPFGIGVDVFYIKAFDQSGNLSAPSKAVTVVIVR